MAHADYGVAADCLVALRNGEGQGEAPNEFFVGALLVAEFIALVRSALTTKATPKAPAAKPRKKR